MGLVAELPDREEDRTHLWVTFERDGRVVGRVVSADGRVRWGSALGLEFTYPVTDAPPAEELFTRGRSGPRLRVREGMAGEIAAGWSTRLSVEDLDALGIARGRKGRRWLPLSSQMRGQVAYRGFQISFHFGPGPEVGEVRRLSPVPLRFRRAPLAREEWPFTLLAWGLYGLLLYLSVYLAARPLPLAPHPEAVAQRFAKLIYEAPQAPSRARTEILKKQEAERAAEPEPEPERAPEPEPEPEKPVTEAKAEPVKPEAPPPEPQTPPEPRPVPQSPEGGGGPTPEQVARRREQIRESVAKKGLLGLLGGRGTASTATARGSILEGRGAAEDLDRILAKVEGLRAAPAGSGEGTGLGGGAGVAGGLGDEELRAAAAASRSVQLQKREDEAVEAVEDQPLDELTLKEAVAAIHRTVGTYLGGIRYLYNRELRKKPDLEGKLTVSITIDPQGAVTECHVVESTLGHPPLEDAVLDRVRKWKFPPVAPRPVTVTYPFVFFPSM